MMLHEFFDERPWFRPKRYGYGAGLPITWQGWALTLSFSLTAVGIGLAIGGAEPPAQWAGAGAILLLTGLFALIVHRRTEGGWRWRWGED